MELIESIQYGTKPLKIDLEKQIIYGVKVIGEESKNGKVFSKQCRTGAHRLIEGLKVNVNHRKKGEDVIFTSRLGRLRNPRDEADGTYADLHYLKSNPLTPMVLEVAERDPGLCGLSILGQGHGKNRDSKGRLIVESISNLQSADLVADPANTVALNESDQTQIVVPVREADEAAVEQEVASIEECLGKLVAACLANGQHDMAGDHMKVHKKHTEKAQEGGDEEEGEETEESLKLKARQDCLQLCESHKVKPAEGLVQALIATKDAAARELVIKAWKGPGRTKTPQSGSPVIPISESVKQPDDVERILAQIRVG